MKKIVIFFIVLIVIIAAIFYMYSDYKENLRQAKIENLKFEKYSDKEIYGIDIVSIINKAVDTNENNHVQKDKKGKYIDNENNSINIDIQFIDDDVIYNMEKIYNSGIEQFLTYYRLIKFKCTDIKYHEFTKKIKYMKFEQITQ